MAADISDMVETNALPYSFVFVSRRARGASVTRSGRMWRRGMRRPRCTRWMSGSSPSTAPTLCPVTTRDGSTGSRTVPPPRTSFARRHPILAAFGVLAGLSLFAAYFPLSAIVTGVVVGAHASGVDGAAVRLGRRVGSGLAQRWRARHHRSIVPPPPPPTVEPPASSVASVETHALTERAVGRAGMARGVPRRQPQTSLHRSGAGHHHRGRRARAAEQRTPVPTRSGPDEHGLGDL